MSRFKSVKISENGYQTSSPILHLSRIFGLAPLRVENNGSHLELKCSLFLILYSLLLGAILVTFGFQGMINEIQLKDNSFRMKGSTSKYVTVVDVIVVEIIVILGILNIPIRSNKLFTFVGCINEIDSEIEATDTKKARAVSIKTLTSIIIGTTLLLAFDLFVWYNAASASNDGEFVITNYLPYHVSYFVVILAECQYAHMAYCIKRRLKLVNTSLEKSDFKGDTISVIHFSKTPELNRLFVKNLQNKSMQHLFEGMNKADNKISDVATGNNAKKWQTIPDSNHVLRLIKVYLKICDAAEAVNDFVGHLVLVTLIMCLYHLTITPYFFVIELTGRCDGMFLALQCLWFFAHLFQLVLVVEPCQICLEEVKAMDAILCRILSSQVSDTYRKELELFFDQLQHRQIEFSAFGLGNVNRSLITSMAGAVTVYFVTIVQFGNSASN